MMLFRNEDNIIKCTIDGSVKSYLYADEQYQYDRCCSTREYDLGRVRYIPLLKKMSKEDIEKFRDGLKFDLARLQEYNITRFTPPISLYKQIEGTTVAMIVDIILRHYICINEFKDTGCCAFWEIKLIKAEKKFSKLLKDVDELLKEMS